MAKSKPHSNATSKSEEALNEATITLRFVHMLITVIMADVGCTILHLSITSIIHSIPVPAHVLIFCLTVLDVALQITFVPRSSSNMAAAASLSIA